MLNVSFNILLFRTCAQTFDPNDYIIIIYLIPLSLKQGHLFLKDCLLETFFTALLDKFLLSNIGSIESKSFLFQSLFTTIDGNVLKEQMLMVFLSQSTLNGPSFNLKPK